MDPRSDAEVIASSVDSPAAFSELFDRHATTLFRYFVRRVGPDEADSLLGELFRIAFERRETFDTARAEARPWLYGIATNQLQHWWRGRARAEAAYRRVARADSVDRHDHDHDLDALDLPIGTVRSRIHRLRAAAVELIGKPRENDGVTADALAQLELEGPRA